MEPNSATFSTESNPPNASNAYMIHTPVGVFFAICPVIVGIRLWSRRRKSGKPGVDDFTILAALGFSLVSGTLMITACSHGYGRHWRDLTPSEKYGAMKITYKASINLTKTSILLLYLRIFTGVRWFRWGCIFVMACIAMFCLATITATIFQCNPIEKAFNQTMKGHCINNGRFWYANASFNIFTDLIILIIPMPLVYGLQIPRVQKAGLVIVFALGIFVVITSCLRTTTINAQARTTDKTFDIASTMWTILEMNVAILMQAYRSSRERDNGIGKDRVNLADLRHPGNDPGSEECIIAEAREMSIQKTVQYSIEYSQTGTASMNSSLA
ncbi:hypothetical protein DL767_009317 [Monosporascus sp. MG133]|nr:hypothetical protein DL767_009317 [Monosporascus sp. MG133]